MDLDLIRRILSKSADETAINELSKILFEGVVIHSRLKKRGETHINRRKNVIPDSLIKYLCGKLLENCFYREIVPNLYLFSAIKELRGVPEYGLKSVGEVHRRKVAILLFANNPQFSISAVAKELKISKSG